MHIFKVYSLMSLGKTILPYLSQDLEHFHLPGSSLLLHLPETITHFLFFWCKKLGVKLSGHRIDVYLTFVGNTVKLFSK